MERKISKKCPQAVDKTIWIWYNVKHEAAVHYEMFLMGYGDFQNDRLR